MGAEAPTSLPPLSEDDRERLRRMAKFKTHHAEHLAKCVEEGRPGVNEHWAPARDQSFADAALLRRLLGE